LEGLEFSCHSSDRPEQPFCALPSGPAIDGREKGPSPAYLRASEVRFLLATLSPRPSGGADRQRPASSPFG
jgi:hypothetical protein